MITIQILFYNNLFHVNLSALFPVSFISDQSWDGWHAQGRNMKQWFLKKIKSTATESCRDERVTKRRTLSVWIKRIQDPKENKPCRWTERCRQEIAQEEFKRGKLVIYLWLHPNAHPSTHPHLFCGTEGENTVKKLMNPDEDREIAYQVLSWANQTQLGENLFIDN